MAKSRVRTSLQLSSEMRGGGICPLPLPTNIFTKERRALWVYIWSFPSCQVNLSKGISESAAFALAELRSCFAGSSCVVALPFGTGLTHRR